MTVNLECGIEEGIYARSGRKVGDLYKPICQRGNIYDQAESVFY